MFTVNIRSRANKRPYNLNFFSHKSTSVGNLIKKYYIGEYTHC